MSFVLLILVGGLFAVVGYRSLQPEPRGGVRLLWPSRLALAVAGAGIFLAFVGIVGLLLPMLAAITFLLGVAAGWAAYKLRVRLSRMP